jgi:dTDP-glucose 4,6-dehydratase
MDTQRSRLELEWSPRIAFNTGLESTVAWYLQNAAWVAKVAGSQFLAYYDAVYTQEWGRLS